MSAEIISPGVPAAEVPAHRYTAELANSIEAAWQDRWEREGTFHTPNPSGPLGDPEAIAGKDHLFILDMFPYPSGAGLHVGHPLGFIGTDVFGRYQRMAGRNVVHAMGFDAFGLPAEQHAIATGIHPRENTEANVAVYRRQLRALGLAHDDRRSIATTDESYYRWTQWIFTVIFNAWFDERTGRARHIDELIAEFDAGERPTPGGQPWSQLTEFERRTVLAEHRLAYLSRGAGELVPGAGHDPRQRGGHRPGPQRHRQLPGVQEEHAPVDDAHHQVRPAPDRRPRPRGLAGEGAPDAAQLDRPQHRRNRALRQPGRPDHRVHHPPRHAVRGHVHGPRPRAPVGRPADHARSRPRRSPSTGARPAR